LENQIPSSPAELFAMQQGGIREEIGAESSSALDHYVRGELFEQINPSMDQVLYLAKQLLTDLESYHFNALEDGELTERQRKIWKRDRKSITKALMALRQVEES